MKTFYGIEILNRWDVFTILADEVSFGCYTEGKFINEALPPGWACHAHHCTIYYGEEEKMSPAVKLFLANNLGKKIYLEVLSFGKSDAVTALKVRARTYAPLEGIDYVMTEFQCMNENPHITLATAPKHTPMEANDIKDWKPFDTTLHYKKMGEKTYIVGRLVKFH